MLAIEPCHLCSDFHQAILNDAVTPDAVRGFVSFLLPHHDVANGVLLPSVRAPTPDDAITPPQPLSSGGTPFVHPLPWFAAATLICSCRLHHGSSEDFSSALGGLAFHALLHWLLLHGTSHLVFVALLSRHADLQPLLAKFGHKAGFRSGGLHPGLSLEEGYRCSKNFGLGNLRELW